MKWVRSMMGREAWRSGAIGSAIAVIFGLCFLFYPVGAPLRLLSYEWPLQIRGPIGAPTNDLVIVYMDPESNTKLHQSPGIPWKPEIHTQLVKKLTAAGARMIVFDVLFTEMNENNTASYAELANAMKKEGAVVVAAHSEPPLQAGNVKKQNAPELPVAPVAAVAPSGIVEFPDYGDGAVRSQRPIRKMRNLAWASAELLGKAPTQPHRERWMNYYGPHQTLHSYSYAAVLSNDVPAAALSGKVVFVGKQPVISSEGPTTGRDLLQTPYGLMPGVEIQATAFLNLVNKEWLEQLGPVPEFLTVVIFGIAAAFGFLSLRPWIAAAVSIIGFVVLAGSAVFLFSGSRLWFAWLIPGAVQIPVALSWAVLVNTRKVYHEKEILEHSVATAKAAAVSAQHETGSGLVRELSAINEAARTAIMEAPTVIVPNAASTRVDARSIGDHELLRPIGKGAYGEVWLGRSLVGIYRAVKVIYRRNFEHAAPFEREFRGLKKFAPVSMSHPGFVQILHVGKNDGDGYFYYVMELGDDESSGQKIDSENYSARNLGKELRKRGNVSVAECVSIGIELAAALDCLHQHELIHRDIKPSNIIFVNGVAKLADIGLVTEIRTVPSDATFVGTPGYIAPEGPGSKGADIFSLGKVLYECSMGRSSHDYPDLPSSLLERPEKELLLDLNNLISKACDPDAKARYATAAELKTELVRFQARIKPAGVRAADPV
jgi:CHASE2 domain-containing sensor protein